MPRVSGNGCPRDSVNLLWDGLPGERKSRETGVGKNEHSPADMRRTKVASRELSSGTVEASARQTSRDLGLPSRIARGLLHDKPFCAGVEADPQHFGPQAVPGSRPVHGCGNAGGLAWRTANNDICPPAGVGPHVIMDGDSWEMMGEQSAPAWLNLDELHNSEAAGGFEADGVAADVAEKVEDIHLVPYR